MLSFGFVSTAIAVAYPVSRYLIPPPSGEPVTTSVVAARAGDLAPNSGVLFKFGAKPGLLVRDASGALHAFSAVCSHLGCTVQYKADTSQIWCACHDALFDLSGNIVSGPPPKPLEVLIVNVRGEEVVVSRG